MDPVRVVYRLRVPASEARARAEEVALEQTVEVPRSAVGDSEQVARVLGRVESLVPDGDDAQLATIAYPAATTALDPAQLVNVMFGMSSLHSDIECIDLTLPAEHLHALGGPRFGIEGLRKTIGVYDRPLTCTALKPMGRSPQELAELLRTFARAGIDVIKDDHGLADHTFCPFEDRVRACLAAADEVADETGHRAVYVPNLIGTPGAVASRLRFAEDHGARAVIAAPLLLGLPAFYELCREKTSVPVLAHPAFGGAQRFAPELLFGRIFRLFGADASVFVSYGSRFDPSPASCRRLADRLVAPWGGLLPSLPVPAGGIAVENAAEVAAFYGGDVMLLVGGSLQVDPNAVAERSQRFVAAVRGARTAAAQSSVS